MAGHRGPHRMPQPPSLWLSQCQRLGLGGSFPSQPLSLALLYLWGEVNHDMFIANKRTKRNKEKKKKRNPRDTDKQKEEVKMTCQFTPRERPLYRLVHFFPVFFLCEHGKNRSRSLEGNRFCCCLLPGCQH